MKFILSEELSLEEAGNVTTSSKDLKDIDKITKHLRARGESETDINDTVNELKRPGNRRNIDK